MALRCRGPGKLLGIWRGRTVLMAAGTLAILTSVRVEGAPRMISYGYPNCIACHVSAQGRGLLNPYGRGIDRAQSYSQADFTGQIFARMGHPDAASEKWDGRFGKALVDFLVTMRVNQQVDQGKTDPTLFALYRQTIFLGEQDSFRINTEVGFQDSGLNYTALGRGLTATGGDTVFLKKLLLEWRIEANGATSGKELALGRDYLPLGLQIDDYTTFILHLNRSGIYDFPLQVKFFAWQEKSLASAFVYAPSFDEPAERREYGGGFLYERYPNNNLSLGVQGLVGFGEESDRLRIGPYARWGISHRWALLVQADYGASWDAGTSDGRGNQVTTFLQLFYHHYEWLISHLTANYAYSDFLNSKQHLGSFRFTSSARLNRNLTLGITFAHGDIQRDLGEAQEAAVFATIKF
jgi:hypothetical protein